MLPVFKEKSFLGLRSKPKVLIGFERKEEIAGYVACYTVETRSLLFLITDAIIGVWGTNKL
ncbi:hypothetical protein NCCP2331_26350 [Sporosarcina sp. NCCP-2331]|nr:hypothetical protein NCCP2331_26350 [Sporosarcina sp. NCCP-2331]GLB56759.1 hypothetical protein NCCP2378_25460 [Sporosarcina sp. NCCP-2378]